MTIWELRCASVNDYAMAVPLNPGDVSAGLFRIDGKPLEWKRPPRIGFADSTRKNHERPPADVSAMVPGAMVLNAHAHAVLAPFLSAFGQLLELDSEGAPGPRFFYNVTHLVRCVDVEHSEKNELGRIRREVFDLSKVPAEAAVFKDPATARSRIYVNDAGKAVIDQLIASTGLSGIECGMLEPTL
ncbi:hypothetical protein IHE49_03645 [Rhodanobacter sp. 7MK24]|uniref:hypothetical protein n=1 Tax=Rhodanobacter sp. 7MK24 TaxID=2775922 RepID=UPI001784D2F4|nr:hypothetical protein [Rhodanobacter sp. 7MK24]MBD8879571.1 hypothetical protein [Rhodanobacter sp. 7MK24]